MLFYALSPKLLWHSRWCSLNSFIQSGLPSFSHLITHVKNDECNQPISLDPPTSCFQMLQNKRAEGGGRLLQNKGEGESSGEGGGDPRIGLFATRYESILCNKSWNNANFIFFRVFSQSPTPLHGTQSIKICEKTCSLWVSHLTADIQITYFFMASSLCDFPYFSGWVHIL